ncbi:hypothetical protein ACR79R_20280 [Sphingobacterium spiritivorum]|uniref:hypothetical protein n=1 Tax=Sphingobacterium spiritivorum TaxID=258 RepID=UPI003DA4138F
MRIIIFLFFLLPINLLAQSESNNFKIDDTGLIWQRVFESNQSPKTIYANLKQQKELVNVELIDSVIVGDISELSLMYKEAGLKWGNTAVYVSGMNTFASFKIDFKENRYRVTISGIKMTMKSSLERNRNNESFTSLQDIEVKNGIIKPGFLKKESVAYNYSFIQLFKPKNRSNDNW